jgi:hypothetical protein
MLTEIHTRLSLQANWRSHIDDRVRPSTLDGIFRAVHEYAASKTRYSAMQGFSCGLSRRRHGLDQVPEAM